MKEYYVYRFLNKNMEVIYVGKTKNIWERLNKHFGKDGHLDKKCYKSVCKIDYIVLSSNILMSIYELFYINTYNPIYNCYLKYNESIDDKYIKIRDLVWTPIDKKYIEYLKKKTENKYTPLKIQNNDIEKFVCINTNEVFNGMSSIPDCYNLTISQKRNIYECCRGSRRSSGKHYETNEKLRWMWHSDYIKKDFDKFRKYKYICITTGDKFYTLKEAKDYFNLSGMSGICDCCNDKRKYHGVYNLTREKLEWMHYDKYLQQPS